MPVNLKKPNKYIFKGDMCEVLFTDRFGNIRLEKGLIDIKNHFFIKDYRWCIAHGYNGKFARLNEGI